MLEQRIFYRSFAMWPKVEYETYDWHSDPDELRGISKTSRRKIGSTYQAAAPAEIAKQAVDLSQDLTQRISEISTIVARFDAEQNTRTYNLPALLLRSESSSSSQIERLTASVKNIALADLSDKAPKNAQFIAANIDAMKTAMHQTGPISIEAICEIHDVLMANTGELLGLRNEQVWIGGSYYSPHGAAFVPPHYSRLENCLKDLVLFSKRADIDLIVKAAIFHAQFETIHPFTDGNGRTGRALLHRILTEDEFLVHASLPVSAGLLSDVNEYMFALDAYHNGEILPIINCLLNALEIAVYIGNKIATSVDGVIKRWQELNTDRKGSASYRLPSILVEQPVINNKYISEKLEISQRAAQNLILTACDRGILKKMGDAKRGSFYQAPELINILEEASGGKWLMRVAPQ